MKKVYKISIFIIFVLVALSSFFVRKPLDHKVNEISYVEKKESLECKMERLKISEISTEPRSVKNLPKHRFFLVELSNKDTVYFITENEIILQDHDLYIAKDCVPLKNKDKMEYDTKDIPCFNIYRYDQEEKQVKLDCGFLTQEKAIFLKP